jgi:hypothetical protein
MLLPKINKKTAKGEEEEEEEKKEKEERKPKACGRVGAIHQKATQEVMGLFRKS